MSIAKDGGGVLWADDGEGMCEMHRGASTGDGRNGSLVFRYPSEAVVLVASVRRRGLHCCGGLQGTKSSLFYQGPPLERKGSDKS